MRLLLAIVAALALAVPAAAHPSLEDHARAAGHDVPAIETREWGLYSGAHAHAAALAGNDRGARFIAYRPGYEDPGAGRAQAQAHAHEIVHHLEHPSGWSSGNFDPTGWAHAAVDAVALDLARTWWATYKGTPWPRWEIPIGSPERKAQVIAIRAMSGYATNGSWTRPIAGRWREILVKAPHAQQQELMRQALSAGRR